jgi:hypothetical protein
MDLRTFLPSLADVIGSLSPSLIGSAVAQAWKPGLSWRQRFVQWIVGSTVSFYVTRVIIEVTGWSDFVAQSIAFGIALLAFDATPRIARAATDALASLPGRLADRFLPGKD